MGCIQGKHAFYNKQANNENSYNKVLNNILQFDEE